MRKHLNEEGLTEMTKAVELTLVESFVELLIDYILTGINNLDGYGISVRGQMGCHDDHSVFNCNISHFIISSDP